jgi:hypothetical protein
MQSVHFKENKKLSNELGVSNILLHLYGFLWLNQT